MLDKIICGGEGVALFCVCVCEYTSAQCVLLLCSFGTQYNTEVVFDLHTVLHMVPLRRRKTWKQGESLRVESSALSLFVFCYTKVASVLGFCGIESLHCAVILYISPTDCDFQSSCCMKCDSSTVQRIYHGNGHYVYPVLGE